MGVQEINMKWKTENYPDTIVLKLLMIDSSGSSFKLGICEVTDIFSNRLTHPLSSPLSGEKVENLAHSWVDINNVIRD